MANVAAVNYPIRTMKSMVLDGYEAHVYCNGARLPEFVVTGVGNDKMACYIPSEAGKEFSLRVTDRLRSSRRKKLYVGLYAHKQFLTGRYLDRGGSIEIDRVISGDSHRKLMFDAVKTAEERPDMINASVDVDSLNIIEVKIWSLERQLVPPAEPLKNKRSPKKSAHSAKRNAEHGWGNRPEEAVEFVGEVNETCKVQGLNTVSLGPEIAGTRSKAPLVGLISRSEEEQDEEDADEEELAEDFDADHTSDDDYQPPKPAKATWQYCFVEPEDKPRAHLIFRHHPKEFLQAMHWMPRSRPSTPAVTEGNSTPTAADNGQASTSSSVEEHTSVEQSRSVPEGLEPPPATIRQPPPEDAPITPSSTPAQDDSLQIPTSPSVPPTMQTRASTAGVAQPEAEMPPSSTSSAISNAVGSASSTELATSPVIEEEDVKPDIKPNVADLEVIADVDALDDLERKRLELELKKVELELKLNRIAQGTKRRRIESAITERRVKVRVGSPEMMDLTLDESD
ncbi:unnamed protein product [Peniophora sp. CBMAI 1063]|nr:unnamed protein product [Peniophora sp. CBMAI 1063]